MPKLGALAATLAAFLCLAIQPAHASIVADFNGDGVLDSVVLPQPPETDIVIHISGSAPQVLKLSARVISIVVADVDHDGAPDVSALSDRPGLLVWLNKAGHGRFAKLKKHHVPRGVGFSRGLQTTALEHGRDALFTSDDRGPSTNANTPRAGPAFDIHPGDYAVPFFPSTFSLNLRNSTAPRGPPSLTAD